MKAVVLEEQGVINVREVPDVKDPGPGELRIAPHTVGVCGSDLHYYTYGRVAGQPTGHVQRRSGCAFLRYSAD